MIITFIACINHKQKLFTVNIYNDSCLYKLKKNMQLGIKSDISSFEPKVCTLIEQFRSFKRYSMHS